MRDNLDAWRACFRDIKARGLDPSCVRVGVMDGLPGLERLFVDEFAMAISARCWFHVLHTCSSQDPRKASNSHHDACQEGLYADGEMAAREAFQALKLSLGNDATRAVACLERDLDSLVTHFRFEKAMWRSLKTTNTVERIHKEFKRRARAMEALGESTLMTVVAFTALKIELGWRMHRDDTYPAHHLQGIMLTGRQKEDVEENLTLPTTHSLAPDLPS